MKTSRALPAVLVFLGLLVSGCSTTAAVESSPSGAASAPISPGPPAPGASPSAVNLCADAASLKNSVTDLASINVLSGGLGGIMAKVTTVQTNLTALQQSAHGSFGPQVAAMRAAVSTLRAGVSAATANPGVATITAVAKDIAAVVSTYKALETAIRSSCG